MPTRILRDWTDSDAVNSLSAEGERLFVRIIMKADDYGRLSANPRLLRPLLYPLLLDQVREADLQRWIAECVRAGLVRLYSVEGKQYLFVVNFGQRLRNTRQKYPGPPGEDPPQLAASCRNSRPDAESDAEADMGLERNRTVIACDWEGGTGGTNGNEFADSSLLDRLVEFSGSPQSRAFYQKAIRALGAGLVDQAMAEVRMRDRDGSVNDRAKYLTATLQDWMAGRGVQ